MFIVFACSVHYFNTIKFNGIEYRYLKLYTCNMKSIAVRSRDHVSPSVEFLLLSSTGSGHSETEER